MNETQQVELKDLKELRVSRGKTQDELGAGSLISRYERGHLTPGARMVAHLANVLGVSPDLVYSACEESRRRSAAAPVAHADSQSASHE